MKFADKFKFIRQNMKKNRSRLMMTILATAIGTSFLIILASVGFGVQQSAQKQVTSRNDINKIEVSNGSSGAMEKADVEKLEKISHVKTVVSRNYFSGMVQLDKQIGQSMIVVTDMESEEKGNLKLYKGEFPKNENEVVVGFDVANGQQDHVIGQTINLLKGEYDSKGEPAINPNAKKESFKIVGVLEKPNNALIEDRNIYIQEANLQKISTLFGNRIKSGSYDIVTVYPEDLKFVKTVGEEIEKNGYTTYSVAKELKSIDTMFAFVKIGLIIVGTIAVLIAAIGIFNTMTMAVTERTQDIGIMKAIGATPKTIKSIFLIESSYIGIIGTLIGVIVAYIVSFGLNFALPMVLHSQSQDAGEGFVFSLIPLSLVLIASAISILMAILSGARPAKRATEVDVLKALRRDM